MYFYFFNFYYYCLPNYSNVAISQAGEQQIPSTTLLAHSNHLNFYEL